MTDDPDEQPSLPIARVAVDVSLHHLDRPFDYAVPADLDEQAVPGSRVRVRFSGRVVDGYVIERCDSTAHEGKLAPLAKSISAEPVLAPEIAGLCRAVADRYAGTLADDAAPRGAAETQHGWRSSQPSRERRKYHRSRIPGRGSATPAALVVPVGARHPGGVAGGLDRAAQA